MKIKIQAFGMLFGASIFGSVAVLPLLLLVQGSLLRSLEAPLWTVLFLQIIQSAALAAVAIAFGLFLAKRTGFGIPLVEKLIERKPIKEALASVLIVAIPIGLLAGFLILVLDATFPLLAQNSVLLSLGPTQFFTSQSSMPPHLTSITPEPWKGFLAAFYGAINEEILMRWFLMSALVWAALFATKKKKKNWAIWFGIVCSSLLFGVGHLPFTATLTALTPYIVTRALLLNGVAGLLFGWLFWKKGLEAAMIAHFTTDIFLFVIIPLSM